MYDESDSLKGITCCVVGHRDIPAEQVEDVKKKLRQAVEQAISEGYIYFLSDFMEGIDQLFAEVVAEIRQENQDIRLEAILSYRNRYKKLFDDKRTHPLITACTEVGFSGEAYARNCVFVNRREQLRRSSRMIAVYDGREDGGTVSAIRMAHMQQIKIQEIPLG